MDDYESYSDSGAESLHPTQPKPFQLKLPDNSPSTCSDITVELCNENFNFNHHNYNTHEKVDPLKDNTDILNSKADLITQSLYDDFNTLQLGIFQSCQESKSKKSVRFTPDCKPPTSVNIE